MKDDEYYIQRALSDMDFVVHHMKTIHNVSELTSNPLLLDSMSFRLIQIAESISHVSDELKKAHRDIPWIDIKGLRNRLVHDYGNVNYSFVYIAVKEDIPELKKQLERLI